MPEHGSPSAFTPIQEIGEFGLIDRMTRVLGPAADAPDLLLGIADDAAVYRVGEGRVHVVTTDALIEHVHFDRAFTPMDFLGFKAVSVNVSDVAAMNARPRYATVALALPSTVSIEMVEAFYRGVAQAADLYGVVVVGGDTTSGHHMAVSVTLIGEAAEADVVYRSGARPGDLLCVTGNVGGAYAGLQILLDRKRALREQGGDFAPDLERYSYVIRRQLTPTARLAVVQAWAAAGLRPHALIDVSDGVASEVHHLCRRSGCGARLEAAALPIDPETHRVAEALGEDADAYALFGGEDYELLFALDPADLERLDPETCSVIGVFTPPDEGVAIQLPEGDLLPLGASGYQHFGGDEAPEES